MVVQGGILGSAEWNYWGGLDKEDYCKGSMVGFGYPWVDENHPEVHDKIIAVAPNRHFLSVAPTRSGKGVSLIIPTLLYYAGSTIVVDPKGENAWITAECRHRDLKQDIFILDPWGEVNRRYAKKADKPDEVVSKFNPLADLNPKDENYADDVIYIADALIINQGKEAHWDDSARELVAGLIAYFVERKIVEKNAEKATLPAVRTLLTKPFNELADIANKVKDPKWVTKVQQLGFESLATRKLSRFGAENREIASIISCALTQTAFLDSATLAANLSESDFSFSDLVNQKATIYLVLPIDKLQTYGRWLRLMVSLGIRTVARHTETLDNPVLFILDEFGTIGRLSAVAQAYGLMAGLQMCIWAFAQNLIQLKKDYPDEWETFISNSEYVSFFNVMDDFTADYVSKLLGTTTAELISDTTKTIRERKFDPSAIYNPKPNPNFSDISSDKYFSTALQHPAEIRCFYQKGGILIGREKPILFKKMEYQNDALFNTRARKDPYHTL